MANLNRVLLIGNLTRDPQLRYTPSQTAVCDFGLAINRRYSGGDGQRREEVCFVDCTAWGRQAETLAKYMKKGRQIFVEGRLNFHTWDTPDGKKRSKLDVTVENFQFLDSGGGGGRQGGPGGGPEDRQAGAGEQSQAGASDFDYSQDLDDDTIPF